MIQSDESIQYRAELVNELPWGNKLYKVHLGKQENLLILQIFLIINQVSLIN